MKMLKNIFAMAQRALELTNCSNIYQLLDFMAPLPKVYYHDRNGQIEHDNLSWTTFPDWKKFCNCPYGTEKHFKNCGLLAMERFANNSIVMEENDALSPGSGEIVLWSHIHSDQDVFDRMLYEKGKETTFYISDLYNIIWNDLMGNPPSLKEQVEEIVGEEKFDFKMVDGRTVEKLFIESGLQHLLPEKVEKTKVDNEKTQEKVDNEKTQETEIDDPLIDQEIDDEKTEEMSSEELIEFSPSIKQASQEFEIVSKYWDVKCGFRAWVYVGADGEFSHIDDADSKDIEYKNYHLHLCSDDKETFDQVCKEIDIETWEKGTFDIPPKILETIVTNNTNKYVYCDSKKVLALTDIKDASFKFDPYLGIATKNAALLKSIVAHVVEYLQGVNEFDNLVQKILNRKNCWEIIPLDGFTIEQTHSWTMSGDVYVNWGWRICGPEKKTQRFCQLLNDMIDENPDLELQYVNPLKNKKINLTVKQYEKQMRDGTGDKNHLAYIFMIWNLLTKDFYKFLEKVKKHEKTFFHWPSGKILKNDGIYHYLEWRGKKICYEKELHDDMTRKFHTMSFYDL